jgi:type I restriction enzyme M protein
VLHRRSGGDCWNDAEKSLTTRRTDDVSAHEHRVPDSEATQAANALRGPLDPGDFKAYVFPVLFFKWISDTWDHEHERAVGDFVDDLADEVEADYHTFTIPQRLSLE